MASEFLFMTYKALLASLSSSPFIMFSYTFKANKVGIKNKNQVILKI